MAADPSLSLRQRKKDATQQAIADAAWELFAERGYHHTSINDIGHGQSRPSLHVVDERPADGHPASMNPDLGR